MEHDPETEGRTSPSRTRATGEDRHESVRHDEGRRGEPRRDESRPGDDGAGSADDGGTSRRPWIVAGALVVVLVGLYFVWPGYEWVIDRTYRLVRQGDQQALRDWVRNAGALGPILVVALMLAQTLVPIIPSVLIMVVAVLAYGAWWGGLLAWGGLLLSGTLAFLIGRALGASAVDRLVGEKTERRIAGYVQRHGVGAVIAARISPALSTDAVSYAAGIVGMRFPRFLLATALGTLPLTALIGFLGANIERLSSGLLWVSIVSIGLFGAWVVFDRIRHGRPKPSEEGRI